MSSGLNGVQMKLKERAPMALLTAMHIVWIFVLTQGDSKLKECKIFFDQLNGLFFFRSLRRTQLLDDTCLQRLPRVAPKRWQYRSRLVSTVFEKSVLKELFHHILEYHDELEEDLCVLLMDLIHVIEFSFLLHTFNGIFENSDMQNYRTKHWIYNSVWQGWRSFDLIWWDPRSHCVHLMRSVCTERPSKRRPS